MSGNYFLCLMFAYCYMYPHIPLFSQYLGGIEEDLPIWLIHSKLTWLCFTVVSLVTGVFTSLVVRVVFCAKLRRQGLGVLRSQC